MTVTNDLLDGISATIAAAGIAVDRADGSDYLPSETGIAYKNMPISPDRMLVLNAYGVGDESPDLALGQRRIQVWGRGTSDPRDVDTLMDEVFDLIHGLTNVTFGQAHVIQILRFSSISMGQDQQSQRWERMDNYQLDIDYPPTPNRT